MIARSGISNDGTWRTRSTLLADALLGGATGDRAREQVLVFYEPLIVSMLRTHVRGHADLQDVAQEVLLRLHRYLPKYDRTRRFRPWLAAIVINQARNLHRAAAHRAMSNVDGLDAEVPMSVDFEEIEFERRLAEVANAEERDLHQLGEDGRRPRDAIAYERHKTLRRSAHEVAAELHMSDEGAVRRACGRYRKRLLAKMHSLRPLYDPSP